MNHRWSGNPKDNHCTHCKVPYDVYEADPIPAGCKVGEIKVINPFREPDWERDVNFTITVQRYYELIACLKAYAAHLEPMAEYVRDIKLARAEALEVVHILEDQFRKQ